MDTFFDLQVCAGILWGLWIVFRKLWAWRKKRIDVDRTKQYNRGYDYACGALMRGDVTAIEMQAQYDHGRDLRSIRFDIGMERAVDDLVALGMKDDRL